MTPIGWHYGGVWLEYLSAFVVPLILIGLLIWLVARTLAQRPPASSGSGGEAEEILRRRFAAGEIDGDEYERRLEVLRRR